MAKDSHVIAGEARSGFPLFSPTFREASAASVYAFASTPFENVKNLADKIKSVKTVSLGGKQVVDIDQFVVAGIFGWPRKGQSSATYKIDKVPNPAGEDLPGLFEYWPVCFDPNYPLPTDANKKDQIVFAFGEASYGGLRIKGGRRQWPMGMAGPRPDG